MTLKIIPSSDFSALIKNLVVQVKYLALIYFIFSSLMPEINGLLFIPLCIDFSGLQWLDDITT